MVETTDLHFLHIDDGGDMMLRLKILRTSDRSKPSSIGWAFKMCLVLFPKPGKHFYEMTEDGENRHPHETYPKAQVLKKAENRWRVIPAKEVRCCKGRVGLPFSYSYLCWESTLFIL